MAKKKGDYQIPFRGGRMMEYHAGRWADAHYDPPVEWRDNKPFDAKVKLTGHWRGRSAARVGLKNVDNGETYSAGLGAFYDAVSMYGVVDGCITGRWVFRKQGANYGLYPYDEVQDGQ